MQKAKQKLHHTFRRGKAHARRVRKHPASLPLAFFVLLVTASALLLAFGLKHHARELTITPNQNHIVLLNIDGDTRTIPTNADTVGELLTKLHITLAANDRVEPDKSELITQDRFRVNVYRGMPVHVIDGLQVYNTVTAAATPRGMVARAGVKLYPEDRVTVTTPENLVLQPR